MLDPHLLRENLPFLEESEEKFTEKLGKEGQKFAEWWILSDQSIRRAEDGTILLGDQLSAYHEWRSEPKLTPYRGELIVYMPQKGWKTRKERRDYIEHLISLFSKIKAKYSFHEDPSTVDVEKKIYQGVIFPPKHVYSYPGNQYTFSDKVNIAINGEKSFIFLREYFHWNSILKYSYFFDGIGWEKDSRLSKMIEKTEIAKKVLTGEKGWAIRGEVNLTSYQGEVNQEMITILSEFDLSSTYLGLEIAGKTIIPRLGKKREEDDCEWYDVIIEVDGVIYNDALLEEANRAPYFPIRGSKSKIHQLELDRKRKLKN